MNCTDITNFSDADLDALLTAATGKRPSLRGVSNRAAFAAIDAFHRAEERAPVESFRCSSTTSTPADYEGRILAAQEAPGGQNWTI